jgi:hypothetical protein
MSVPRSRFASGQQPDTQNITITNFSARDRTETQDSPHLTAHWQITQFAAIANMLRKLAHFNRSIWPHKLLEKRG